MTLIEPSARASQSAPSAARHRGVETLRRASGITWRLGVLVVGALAAWVVFAAAIAGVAGILLLVVPPTIDQVDAVAGAVTDGTDDVEQWLEEGPLGLDPEDVQRYTRDPVGRLSDLVSESSASVVAGARSAAEVVIGTVLALVLTFFLLKDGRHLQRVATAMVPVHRRSVLAASAARAWSSLGGFLRGAAILGAVEGAIIGVTMFVVGAFVAVPLVSAAWGSGDELRRHRSDTLLVAAGDPSDGDGGHAPT